MGNLGFTEIMLILVVVLLLFGAKRLPEVGASIGKGIREFKRSMTDTQDAIMGSDDAQRNNLPPRQADAPRPAADRRAPGRAEAAVAVARIVGYELVTLSDAKGACLEACPLRVAQGDAGTSRAPTATPPAARARLCCRTFLRSSTTLAFWRSASR